MKDFKDLKNEGAHDYDASTLGGWKTFSVSVFKWVKKNDGKSLKKSRTIVRVSGSVNNKAKVFEMADSVVKDLNAGVWDGRKTVSVRW